MKLQQMIVAARSFAASKTAQLLAGITTGMAVAQVASADAIDVTGVTGALSDAGTAIATVGAAVLVVIVGVVTYKLIRRAL